MSSALPKPLKDSLATRPEIQINHTRGGRQSLAPVDINTLGPDPHGLKRLMLTAAEGNVRSRNLLQRFGNVVEFPLQYLVVIVKSITYLSFRFLCGKYFACFKPLWKCLR